MTWHCITWHDTTQAITSHEMTWPPHQMTWHASKQVTSPPWNSRRLVHSKEMVWASRWSVALRTFYRQILSLLYSSFIFWNFRPRLARELLVYVRYCIHFTFILYPTLSTSSTFQNSEVSKVSRSRCSRIHTHFQNILDCLGGKTTEIINDMAVFWKNLSPSWWHYLKLIWVR